MGGVGKNGGRSERRRTGYVDGGVGGQTLSFDSIKAYTGYQTLTANTPPALPSLSTPHTQAIRAPQPRKSAPSGSSQERADSETDREPSDEASIQGQSSEGYQTTLTPSSDDESWKPVGPFRRGRLRKRRSPSGPAAAAAAESPSHFISLLSSDEEEVTPSSGASMTSSDSDSEVVVVRSHKYRAGVLKRKFRDALEPEGRKVRPRLGGEERVGERQWSQRDRGVLAEALQDGLDFRKVGEVLGREPDDVFRMFTKVISATLLHAPSRSERGTQTD